MGNTFHNVAEYDFHTLPHVMTDLWSANMKRIKGDQREFHKVLTSRQMHEMSKSKEEMLSKRKMIQRQVKEKIVSVVGRSAMEVMQSRMRQGQSMAQRYGIYKAPSMDNLIDDESIARLHSSVDLARQAS